MSRTRKDSLTSPVRRELEIVKNDDHTFDLFSDGKQTHAAISERLLNEELCVRYGYCGQEFNSIVEEVNLKGRKTLYL